MKNPTKQTTKSLWNWKALLLCHLAIAFLLGTFLWPVTKDYWDILDRGFFTFINSSLEGNKAWQIFWAFANHRNADWVEDVCFLLFFIAYVRSVNGLSKERKIAQMLFCTLFSALVIFSVNHMVFRELISVYRSSPSIVVEGSIRVSKILRWISIKDSAYKCFPSDHATTALLFAVSYSFFANKKLAIIACLYTVFLCMPRLILGAHWLSDVLVGAGSITILFLGWALCTPIHYHITNYCERMVRFCYFWRKKTSTA